MLKLQNACFWPAVAMLVFCVPPTALAQDQGDETDGETPVVAEEEEPLELAAQTVTGSRLLGGDPSAKVFTLTADDIQRRGVSSVEDLFRTLPWTYSSINTQTNLYTIGENDVDTSLGALGLGISSVNLRALGSANTLVLVNGRRIAGAPGNDDNFVNLLNVPLAAVERVDIQLDGASAVYGSDAIGGVVNFVLRKDYSGTSLTARQEFSATGADRRNLELLYGTAWDSGNLNASISRSDSKPIQNRKLWTSNDYRSQYGPEFDLRTTNLGQPGVACTWNGSYLYPGCSFLDRNRYQLISGSGAGATADDFTTEVQPFDYVHPENGAKSETLALQLDVEQYLTDNLRVYGSVLISEVDSRQLYQSTMSSYLVPASNAYNPFGRTMVVNYYPLRELEEGRIPYSYTESVNEQRNYSAGLYWELGGGHQLQVDFNRSESESESSQWRTDYGIASRGGSNNPDAPAFYRAVDSSDPNVALNLFGDGTMQGSAFDELLTSALGPSLKFTEQTTIKPLLRGETFRIWGGPIRYVLGAEHESRTVYSHHLGFDENGMETLEQFGRDTNIGVKEPEKTDLAYFTELAFPFFSPENARPGLAGLTLSVQARRDEHEYTAARGGISSVFDCTVPRTSTYWVPNEGWTTDVVYPCSWVDSGAANLVEDTKTSTTQRIGVHYQPIPEVTLRLSWQDSFKPPSLGDLFHQDDAVTYGFPLRYYDPYDPDGRDNVYLTTTRASYNPLVEDETSDTFRVVLDWSPAGVPGLTLSVDWSKVEFQNKIEYASLVLYDFPEIGFAPGSPYVERDANNYATSITSVNVLNLSEKVSEILEFYAQYDWDTRFGNFISSLRYTRVLDEYFTVAPGDPPVDRVGTASGSDEYKIIGSLGWLRGRFSADMWAYYTPSYINDRTGNCSGPIGNCQRDGFWWRRPKLPVDAMTKVDLTLTYQFDNGLRLRGGGRNIFDANSPTVWSSLPYDPTRYDARGRVFFLEVNFEM